MRLAHRPAEVPPDLTVTFRGTPPCEELLFYARRLHRTLPGAGCAAQLDVSPSRADPGAVRVVLREASGTRRAEAVGDSFVAVRDVFDDFTRYLAPERGGPGGDAA